MSGNSPELPPKSNNPYNISPMEDTLLGLEYDVTRLLEETDGFDFQPLRGSFFPKGIVRVERSLYMCEFSGIGNHDYLSVTDVRKTTPAIGGQFYRIREERIPVDGDHNNALMLDYAFKTTEGLDINRPSFRVAHPKKATFSLTEKARPELARKFPFQKNIQTLIENKDLVLKAEGKEPPTVSEKLEAPIKQKGRLDIEEAKLLQKTIGKLLDEFVDIGK